MNAHLQRATYFEQFIAAAKSLTGWEFEIVLT